jgi:hypothetical protein
MKLTTLPITQAPPKLTPASKDPWHAAILCVLGLKPGEALRIELGDADTKLKPRGLQLRLARGEMRNRYDVRQDATGAIWIVPR